MKNIRSLSLLIACIATTACGSSSSGLDELKRLCEKDAGLTINKTVEVDGLYDTTRKGDALWMLISSKYKFVEFCNLDTKRPSFGESGCWRLTKVSRDTGQCNDTVDKAMKRNGSDSSREFRDKNCIAVEKIEKPVARYSYHSNPKQWFDGSGVSRFFRADVYVEDTVTSEILGRFISYSFDENPQFTPTISCKRLGDKYPSYLEANLIQTVLKPKINGVRLD